jgi:hypothetical protein
VSTLQRTIALAKVQGRPLIVDRDLHLDMVRGAQVLLQIDGSVAERRLCLLHAEGEVPAQFGGVLRDAHPAAATTSRCLQDDRVPDLLRRRQRRRLIGDHAL